MTQRARDTPTDHPAPRPFPVFWVFNHAVNPALIRLLRGPLGPRVGSRVVVLTYSGRRSSVARQLVAQTVADGSHLWIVPGAAGRKRWWRNFRSPGPVEVLVGGRTRQGTAVAFDDRSPAPQPIGCERRTAGRQDRSSGPSAGPAGEVSPVAKRA